MSSVITPKQRDRLLNRPGDESDEEIRKDRRLNDFYVRKALKRWFGSIQDINLALNALPKKQITELFKEETKDEDVFVLLEIAERALVNLDFMPIQRNEDGKLIAVKRLETKWIDGISGPTFPSDREATDLDKGRYSTLRKHISRLKKFVHPRQYAIHNDLDSIYFKDLIIKAKKEGYEPATRPEIDRFVPRLTPKQYQFQEDRGILDQLGFCGIEHPADLETLKEALRSREGKAFQEKFKSMQEEQHA